MKTINLLQQTAILGFVGSTVLFTPFASRALTVQEVTNPRKDHNGWVSNMADILINETLSQFFITIEKDLRIIVS
jgi:hypothetical protein